MKASSGFTLVEMVLVMVLVGILSAVAVPRLATHDYESAFFTDSFVSALRYGQKIALAMRSDIGVIRENDRYRFMFRDDDGNFSMSVRSPYSTERGQPFRVEIPEDVQVEGPPVDIYFSARGKVINASTDEQMIGDVVFHIDDAVVRMVSETGFVYEDKS